MQQDDTEKTVKADPETAHAFLRWLIANIVVEARLFVCSRW